MAYNNDEAANVTATFEKFQDKLMDLATYYQSLSSPIYSASRRSCIYLAMKKIVKLPEHKFQNFWKSWCDDHRLEYDNKVRESPEREIVWRNAARSMLDMLRAEMCGCEWAEQCLICLRDVESSGGSYWGQLMLPCSHVFHKNCILKWLKNNQSCPHCGAKTPDVRVHDNGSFSVRY